MSAKTLLSVYDQFNQGCICGELPTKVRVRPATLIEAVTEIASLFAKIWWFKIVTTESHKNELNNKILEILGSEKVFKASRIEAFIFNGECSSYDIVWSDAPSHDINLGKFDEYRRATVIKVDGATMFEEYDYEEDEEDEEEEDDSDDE